MRFIMQQPFFKNPYYTFYTHWNSSLEFHHSILLELVTLNVLLTILNILYVSKVSLLLWGERYSWFVRSEPLVLILMLLLYATSIFICIVSDSAVSKKQIGKHSPKHSRRDTHCYTTILVIHCMQCNFNWYKVNILGSEQFKAQ
jgi:hypothetical protein